MLVLYRLLCCVYETRIARSVDLRFPATPDEKADPPLLLREGRYQPASKVGQMREYLVD